MEKANLISVSLVITPKERKQTNKLRNIETTIMEGEMPVSSYTALHRDAKLNEAEKKLISEWVSAAKDSIALKN